MPYAAPHGGLGLKAYSQVTSPIRRYADLILHRQLKTSLNNESPTYSHSDLLEMVPKIEQKTAAIQRLQRSSERFWILEFLRQRGVGAVYEGAVIRLQKYKDRRTHQSATSAAILMHEISHIETVRGISSSNIPSLGSRVRVQVLACDPHSGFLQLQIV
eukprot:CAMPEP_0179437960 /NCGR_PEP_ID=MMETSP0799-20121207/21756_1 /TAXON_ID=46947 /ORGANISM="Geminigera cryophila, Strain CCMP2564" /LENGTH=158 /DNA_ID=CAMNT_0021219225 /DNA_START=76 /DNA_END=552 /DNA_ORIENTATION=-